MPILLLLLLIGVLLYLWIARRNSTLTRNCRWRADRSLGPAAWRCAFCGAVTETKGAEPRACLRPGQGGDQAPRM